jgi:hypothetical protein
MVESRDFTMVGLTPTGTYQFTIPINDNFVSTGDLTGTLAIIPQDGSLVTNSATLTIRDNDKSDAKKCDGVARDARIGGRMLACLGELGIRVDLVSHGPGDVGLSCALAESKLQPAMEALHAAFFPGERAQSARGASGAGGAGGARTSRRVGRPTEGSRP